MSANVPPIRREIRVDAGPDIAFEVFTDGIARWWPIADLSVFGEGASVGFEDGRIIERSLTSQEAVWGTVTQWEPGRVVAFTWHPGREADRASHVTVTFAEAESGAAPQTLVTLVHDGWESFDDPETARAEYDNGWPEVLAAYAAAASSGTSGDDNATLDADDAGAETWVALLHRPGAAAPAVGSIFDDPRFGDHVAFLQRMQAAGYLVAAGPLADQPGEGMTVLRLPGADRLDEAHRLATEDDASVAGGFFDVTVRPWQVVLRGVTSAQA